ncbi:MAG: DUF1565 domain-containing protein, partial [Myxococcales bacterium]|nr:DUF1565 domain-containing protein [Myxococcales bacterium]
MRFAVLVAVVLGACANGNRDTPDAGVPTDAGNDASAPSDAPVVVIPACGDVTCDVVFVALSGDDGAAGTKAAPVRTIAAAITKAAAANPVRAVFVQAGAYEEAIEMADGVSIFGGFDTTWTRVASATTEIIAPSPAVVFDDLAASTALDGLTIKSADATEAGTSSVAVVVTGSPKVELRGVTLLPGRGANGVSGTDGTNGGIGLAGGVGKKGVERSTSIGCDNDPLPAV